MADVRDATTYIETLDGGVATAQAVNLSIEAATASTGEVRQAVLYVEVLTPATLEVFIGWGMPI